MEFKKLLYGNKFYPINTSLILLYYNYCKADSRSLKVCTRKLDKLTIVLREIFCRIFLNLIKFGQFDNNVLCICFIISE